MKRASLQLSRGMTPSRVEDFLSTQKDLFAELDEVGLLLWKGISRQSKKVSVPSIDDYGIQDPLWRGEYRVIYQLLFLVFVFHRGDVPVRFWRKLALEKNRSLIMKHPRQRDLEQQLNIVAGDLVITLMNKKIHLLQLSAKDIVSVAAFFACQLQKLSEAEYIRGRGLSREKSLFYATSMKALASLHQSFHSF